MKMLDKNRVIEIHIYIYVYIYICILPGSCEYPLSNSKQGGGFQVNI